MQRKVKYPIGIQSFDKIREDNFIYVDKTEVIYRLVDSTPETALNQIDSKAYSLQWEPDSRKIIKIGINFSSKTRNLDNWIIV